MATIPYKKILYVKKLYYKDLFSMEKVAEDLGVSMSALVYFMRKYDLKRRTPRENEKIKFAKKPLSFNKQKLNTPYLKELAAIGIMLYWAEGYKGDEFNCTVDFANSDPLMIKLFVKFFRLIYKPNEKKMRIYLYCYSNQNIKNLINFWSKLTKIPRGQFLKPYVRSDFREGGRKMKYGLIHIRYHDKKLLIDIKSMIESYVFKYAPIV